MGISYVFIFLAYARESPSVNPQTGLFIGEGQRL